jgi:hypothetical protein
MSPELREAVALPTPFLRFSVLRRAAPPLAALACLAASVLLLARRPDSAAVPLTTFAIVGAGLVGSFVAALGLLLVRGRTGAGSLAVLRLVFPPAALGVFLAVSSFAYETIPPGTYPPRAIQVFLSAEVAPLLGGWVRHLPCTVLGLGLGLGLTGLVLRSAARVAITTPRASGAACGAAAGLAAAFVLFLFCPVHLVEHLLAVHAIPLVVCAVLGFKAGVH